MFWFLVFLVLAYFLLSWLFKDHRLGSHGFRKVAKKVAASPLSMIFPDASAVAAAASPVAQPGAHSSAGDEAQVLRLKAQIEERDAQMVTLKRGLLECQKQCEMLQHDAAANVQAYGSSGDQSSSSSAAAASSTSDTISSPADQHSTPKEESDKDDLKAIFGIGPAMEKTLNEAGIHTFRDLAGLDDTRIEALGDRIGSFRDRIRQDDWTGGARKAFEEKYGRSLG